MMMKGSSLLLVVWAMMAGLLAPALADQPKQRHRRTSQNPTTESTLTSDTSSSSASSYTRPVDRKVQVLNEAKSKIELNWINPQTKERVLMSTPNILPGADFALNSFVDHAFEVVELPDASTGKCALATGCRTSNFAVSAHDDQVVRVTPDVKVDIIDSVVKAQQEASRLVSDCQEQAKQKIREAAGDKQAALAAMEELVHCVEGGVAQRLEQTNEEIAFQASVRKGIAEKLENYTCVDEKQQTSPSIATDRWYSAADGVTRQVEIKHDRPASRIHVIENFISDDECQAMEEEALKKLHRATVADGKGGSRLSDARKAMQAGISVPWHLEHDEEEAGGAIARLSRRVYDYTNHVLGLNIEEHGQEDLMSIQYFGRGSNDTEPDRYTPHCDGDCTGLPHKTGTRMATMVMYCDVADRGGHTNFRNSGVHVKPQRGNAIFFSYIDPDTLIMDTGFTEHSGCPVFEGSKKIVTQWIRLGVDKLNPWDSFNTLGIKIADLHRQEAEAHAQMVLDEDNEDYGDELFDEDDEEGDEGSGDDEDEEDGYEDDHDGEL